jgi:hypothetical protein
MATAFSRIKSTYPRASKDELLLATLRSRFSESEIDDERAAEWVAKCEGKLSELAVRVVQCENPGAIEAAYRFPENYALMTKVIRSEVAAITPGE